LIYSFIDLIDLVPSALRVAAPTILLGRVGLKMNEKRKHYIFRILGTSIIFLL